MRSKWVTTDERSLGSLLFGLYTIIYQISLEKMSSVLGLLLPNTDTCSILNNVKVTSRCTIIWRQLIDHARVLCASEMFPVFIATACVRAPRYQTSSIQPLFCYQMDLLMAREKNAYAQILETHTLSILTPTLPTIPSLPFSMCFPMAFRSPPAIPNIISPHSRNSQIDQIHFPSLRL